jgi:hypothetical protein
MSPKAAAVFRSRSSHFLERLITTLAHLDEGAGQPSTAYCERQRLE